MKCQNCGKKEGISSKFRTKDGVFTRQLCLCEDCAKQFESVSFKGRVRRHRNKIIVLVMFIAVVLLVVFLRWWQEIHEPLKWL